MHQIAYWISIQSCKARPSY